MIIKKTMNTTVQKLHDFILEMVVQDIRNTSNEQSCQTINTSDIKEGFTYTKSILNKTGKQGSVKTRIETLKPGQYQVSFTSANGVNTVQYSYNQSSEDDIELVYEEHFESDAKLKNMNHAFMSTLYKRSNRRRINALLNQIEQLVNEQPV